MSSTCERIAIFTRRDASSRRVIFRMPMSGFLTSDIMESSPVGCGKRRMDDSGRGEHSSAATGGDV